MKESYLLRNRSRRGFTKKILVVIVIFLFGAFIFSLFDSRIQTVFSVFWKKDNAFSNNVGNFFSSLKLKSSLVKENETLKEKVASLESQIITTSNFQEQEASILNLSSRKPEPEAFIATVLVQPPETPYDVLIIDAGSNNSLVIGSQIFSPEAVPLGTVSEVNSKNSRVDLYTSNGKETEAILERNNVSITLIGEGGGVFKFSLPREAEVEIGDRIITRDLQSRLIAVVGDVTLEATDSFKSVLAKSPANIFNLRFIFAKP